MIMNNFHFNEHAQDTWKCHWLIGHIIFINDHLCGDVKMMHWAFFRERVHLTRSYESLDNIVPNYQSDFFISHLCLWSIGMRHQQHLEIMPMYFDFGL